MDKYFESLLNEYKYKKYDEKYIEKVVNFLFDYNELNDYYTGLNFEEYIANPDSKEPKQKIASYDMYEKNVNVTMKLLEDQVIKNNGVLKGDIVFTNIFVIQILMHEVEHAKQNRIISTEDTIESQILNLSIMKEKTYYVIDENFDIFTRFFRKFFKKYKYYNRVVTSKLSQIKNDDNHAYYIPEERMAQINSFWLLAKSLTKSDVDDRIIRILKNNAINYKYNKYEQIDYMYPSPTLYYFENILQIFDDLNKLSWYYGDETEIINSIKDTCDLSERIYLGLPTTNEEWKQEKEKDIKRLML